MFAARVQPFWSDCFSGFIHFIAFLSNPKMSNESVPKMSNESVPKMSNEKKTVKFPKCLKRKKNSNK